MKPRWKLGVGLVVVAVGALAIVAGRGDRARLSGDGPKRAEVGLGPASSAGGAEASPGMPGPTGAPVEARGPGNDAAQNPRGASDPALAATHARRAPLLDPSVRVRAPAEQAAANARSVVEAARTGQHPERLSPLIAANPFDPEAFARDPQAYLDVIEPGRVFQSADEEEGVTSLEPQGPVHLETPPEGSVRLSVTGEPLSPVTFTSFDRGAFENDLTSITVLADAAGAASVRFTATAGTIEDVNILSASPRTVGQVSFRVTVTRE